MPLNISSRDTIQLRHELPSNDLCNDHYWGPLSLIADGHPSESTSNIADFSDIRTSALVDVPLYHGELGQRLDGPRGKTETQAGTTFALTFDPVVAGSYGVRRAGIVNGLIWRRLQLRALCGIWFSFLQDAEGPEEAVRIAIPKPGPTRGRRGFADEAFGAAALSRGFDGYATGDCCLIDDRNHITLHIFPSGFPKLKTVYVAEHRMHLLHETVERRALPWWEWLMRGLPMTRTTVRIITDHRTVYETHSVA